MRISLGHDPSCVCYRLYYGMVWNHSATTKPRACVPHTPYTLILRFASPAGRVCGVATHAVGGNAGCGLLAVTVDKFAVGDGGGGNLYDGSHYVYLG